MAKYEASKLIEVNGVCLHYVVEGEGKPVQFFQIPKLSIDGCKFCSGCIFLFGFSINFCFQIIKIFCFSIALCSNLKVTDLSPMLKSRTVLKFLSGGIDK